MNLLSFGRLALAALLSTAFLPTLTAKPKPKRPVVHYIMEGQIDGLEANHHATIRITGKEPHTASTKNDGTFTIRSVEPGSYTVRPQRTGYRFSPTFRTVAVRDHNVGGISFTAHRLPPKKR
jgi:hypothetical protein